MEMTLSTLISTLPLEMLRGNAFLEVRRRGADKTTIVNAVLLKLATLDAAPDFVFVAGDGAADEGMFAMLDSAHAGTPEGEEEKPFSPDGRFDSDYPRTPPNELTAGGSKAHLSMQSQLSRAALPPSIIELRASSQENSAPPSPAHGRSGSRRAQLHGATHSYSVIVGREPSCAQFRVENAAALTSCLSMLTESDGQSSSRDSTAQSLFSSSS
jgi:hypothetical protein